MLNRKKRTKGDQLLELLYCKNPESPLENL